MTEETTSPQADYAQLRGDGARRCVGPNHALPHPHRQPVLRRSSDTSTVWAEQRDRWQQRRRRREQFGLVRPALLFGHRPMECLDGLPRGHLLPYVLHLGRIHLLRWGSGQQRQPREHRLLRATLLRGRGSMDTDHGVPSPGERSGLCHLLRRNLLRGWRRELEHLHWRSLLCFGIVRRDRSLEASHRYPIEVQTACAISSGQIYCVGGFDASSSGEDNSVYYASLASLTR